MAEPVDDTGWKQPDVVVPTETGPKALVVPATGLEEKPCFTCKSFEKNVRKLMDYFNAHGLVPDADGYYETPIAKDFQGRRSLRIHPRDFGFCRKECAPTHMRATCEMWAPTRFANELALKLVKP